MQKKIVVTGATGLVGKKLCEILKSRGDKISVVSQNKDEAKKIIPFANNIYSWKEKNFHEVFEDVDSVIHLSGANIGAKRWSDSYKEKILSSRIETTKLIVSSFKKLSQKPKSFIGASAIGIYGDRGDELLTENSSLGSDFLADVCKEWESETEKASELGIRTCSMRTGIVLSNEEGAMKKMLLPFKLFVGGPLGNGKQYFSWVHIDDVVNGYLFCIDNNVNGKFNLASPNPVTMKEFAKTLGIEMKRPALFNVPKFALQLILGEGADAVLASQKIKPERLLNEKFQFKFLNLQKAIKNLLHK